MMQSNLDFWAIFLMSGAAQGLFQAQVLALNKGSNPVANRFLAMLILLFSLRLLEFMANWTGYILLFPHLTFSTGTFEFLFGTLIFFYSRALLHPQWRPRLLHLLHFVPFLVHFLYLLPFYSQDANFKKYVLTHFILTSEPTVDYRFAVLRASQITHMQLYLLLAAKEVRRADASSQHIVSSNQKWLAYLLFGLLGFVIFELVQTVIVWKSGRYFAWIDYFKLTFLATIIYGVGYAALREPKLFTARASNKNGRKYEKSALKPELAGDYTHRLIEKMKRQRLYLDSDLTLQRLAKEIRVSPHHLSQVINEQLGQNFFDFVNHYRVEEAKNRLVKPAHNGQTILSVAYEVGFNSKATFNAAFKKHVGMTPSQFRKTACLQNRL